MSMISGINNYTDAYAAYSPKAKKDLGALTETEGKKEDAAVSFEVSDEAKAAYASMKGAMPAPSEEEAPADMPPAGGMPPMAPPVENFSLLAEEEEDEEETSVLGDLSDVLYTATEDATLVKEEEEEETSTTSTDGIDREAIKNQLALDKEQRAASLANMVSQMLGGQAKASVGGVLSALQEAQATEETEESSDDYWSAEAVSQRIFDFAMALTGGDADLMEEMRAAFEKGYSQASDSWSGDLPSVCSDTYDAVQKLFDDYASSLSAS